MGGENFITKTSCARKVLAPENSRPNSPSLQAAPIRVTLPVMELTRDQLQARKEKAVRFTRDVLGDPERAEEIAEDSLEDYAKSRKIKLTNPSKRRPGIMASRRTIAELEAEVADLQEENQDLRDQLDAIADIVSPDEDEGEEDEDQD